MRLDTRNLLLAFCALALLASVASAHEPDFTDDLDRARCTFATSGNHPYFPLWPGYQLVLEGEEEDDEGETVEIEAILTVTTETEIVDGVNTRVFVEQESEDGELVEISRNFLTVCRETGDIWYFGEDVDDYEDGEIVGHEGAWRAGVDGALAGIFMPGNPLIGARFMQEVAPGVALDRAEIIDLGGEVEVPFGKFEDVLEVADSNALDPGAGVDTKLYAKGVGNIADEVLELVDMTLPPCLPDQTTHCLQDGRFMVQVEWVDFEGVEGDGHAILASGESGEFWFFSPENTELIVKVLDACDREDFNSFWVFAAGLTNVEVELTVTDTQSMETQVYDNDLGSPFQPVLDTAAFATCP